MRYLFMIIILFALVSNAEEVKKNGFLTSKWCAENGYFSDCRLESHVCGEANCFKNWEFGDGVIDELALFVHDEGRYYELDISNIKRYELDSAINRNNVEITGEIKDGIIVADKFKAPPPPKKEFFKGCL